MRYDDTNQGIVSDILSVNKAFVSQKFAASDNFPTSSDISDMSATLGFDKLSREHLHVFDKKLAVDSWGVGMMALILLLGEYPFRALMPYETIPAIQLLSEAIWH